MSRATLVICDACDVSQVAPKDCDDAAIRDFQMTLGGLRSAQVFEAHLCEPCRRQLEKTLETAFEAAMKRPAVALGLAHIRSEGDEGENGWLYSPPRSPA